MCIVRVEPIQGIFSREVFDLVGPNKGTFSHEVCGLVGPNKGTFSHRSMLSPRALKGLSPCSQSKHGCLRPRQFVS